MPDVRQPDLKAISVSLPDKARSGRLTTCEQPFVLCWKMVGTDFSEGTSLQSVPQIEIRVRTLEDTGNIHAPMN